MGLGLGNLFGGGQAGGGGLGWLPGLVGLGPAVESIFGKPFWDQDRIANQKFLDEDTDQSGSVARLYGDLFKDREKLGRWAESAPVSVPGPFDEFYSRNPEVVAENRPDIWMDPNRPGFLSTAEQPGFINLPPHILDRFPGTVGLGTMETDAWGELGSEATRPWIDPRTPGYFSRTPGGPGTFQVPEGTLKGLSRFDSEGLNALLEGGTEEWQDFARGFIPREDMYNLTGGKSPLEYMLFEDPLEAGYLPTTKVGDLTASAEKGMRYAFNPQYVDTQFPGLIDEALGLSPLSGRYASEDLLKATEKLSAYIEDPRFSDSSKRAFVKKHGGSESNIPGILRKAADDPDKYLNEVLKTPSLGSALTTQFKALAETRGLEDYATDREVQALIRLAGQSFFGPTMGEEVTDPGEFGSEFLRVVGKQMDLDLEAREPPPSLPDMGFRGGNFANPFPVPTVEDPFQFDPGEAAKSYYFGPGT